jgi:23S rRNA pseudouridine1911/1915/1917 synthase
MPESADAFHFIADKGDARSRLDRILVRRIKDVSRFSRNLAQQWIESGIVAVDGRPALRASTRVREGACISIEIPPHAPRRARPVAEEAALSVLYEDDTMLVVDKPAGVVVHPSYKQLSGTLLNAVLWRTRENAAMRPGIVTRLDKDTSGLVLVALTADAHATLQRDAAARTLRKRYLACVTTRPSPPAGRITLPIGRDPHDRRRMIVTDDGAPSETHYEVIGPTEVGPHTNGPRSERVTLVTCTLMTGRTHQIRVHLAACGWPIAGDRVYGAPPHAIGRQALHAWRLSLRHPLTREPLTFESPLPRDMRELLEAHGTMPDMADHTHTETPA